MDSLESSETWHLVGLSPGCKPISCKWILKKKLKPDEIVDWCKARLVAKGFRQRKYRFLRHLLKLIWLTIRLWYAFWFTKVELCPCDIAVEVLFLYRRNLTSCNWRVLLR